MGRLIGLSALLLLVTARVLSLPSTVDPLVAVSEPLIAISQLEHNVAVPAILPITSNSTGLTCANVRERREWRSLTDAEKASFISAVKCLQSTPVSSPELPEVKTWFDQLQAVHRDQAPSVHGVGEFLPWHRYFVLLFEKSLREQCSYKGDIPYWNWSLDVDNGKKFSESPVFSSDPIIGFGGDGVPGTYTLPPDDPQDENRIVSPAFYRGCVKDGAFSGLELQIGPGKNVGPHCLTRGIDNDLASKTLNGARVERALAMPDFKTFWIEIEGQPGTPGPTLHDGGHMSIGGEMSNFYSSPADPLFYLHHCYLDLLWSKWQNLDAKTRMLQISGNTVPDDNLRNVTTDYHLYAGRLGSDRPVRVGDMMDIEHQPNCYKYVDYAP